VLAHTLKGVAPAEHVMESLLIDAENIFNSRPLTHLPEMVDQEGSHTLNRRGITNVPDLPGDREERR